MDSKVQSWGSLSIMLQVVGGMRVAFSWVPHSILHYQSAITFFLSSSSGPHSLNKFLHSLLLYLMSAPQPSSPWLLLNQVTENVLMKFTDISLWLSQWTLFSSSLTLSCIQTAECNLVLKDFLFHFHFFACFWPLNPVILFVGICFSFNFIMDKSQSSSHSPNLWVQL